MTDFIIFLLGLLCGWISRDSRIVQAVIDEWNKPVEIQSSSDKDNAI